MAIESGIREPVWRVALVIKTNAEETHYSKEMSIPDMKHLVGDGEAKVTVSADLSNKQYGNGASVMVSVTATVDQSTEVVEEAFGLLRMIVAEEGERALSEMTDVVKSGQK